MRAATMGGGTDSYRNWLSECVSGWTRRLVVPGGSQPDWGPARP